jgi:DNA-binding PadR family transcriptional regulator
MGTPKPRDLFPGALEMMVLRLLEQEPAHGYALVQRITVGQMNPPDVVKRYVELVEADKTELVNFIPPDIVERMSKSMPAR